MNAFYEHITLDKNIPVPLYFQLKQAIADAVQRGELAIGEQLPTEMELCDLLHISRPTVFCGRTASSTRWVMRTMRSKVRGVRLSGCGPSHTAAEQEPEMLTQQRAST